MSKNLEMACQVTAGSGMSRGLEDALEAKVQGKCEGKKIVFSVYFLLFPYPKIFWFFFPHTRKNRNRRKSNLLP